MYKTPLIKNHPNPDSIEWTHLDKESYMEIENILTDGVVFFEPFLVDNFYSDEDFAELVQICNSYDLKNVDYSNQMNKWEEQIQIPQKFTDMAIEKVKNLIGTEDVYEGYHMYAHHQITSEGRVPRLPIHIDWSPGPYMVDLHIGGNRDWGFVAGYTNFITKPNQAIICQPQFDYHYRPSWNNNDPNEYYQAMFFHLINLNHWVNKSGNDIEQRSKILNDKYTFGNEFRQTEIFLNFQKQRSYIFGKQHFINCVSFGAPEIPFNEKPTEEDANIHEARGIIPKNYNN
jgi:hypothetical protein